LSRVAWSDPVAVAGGCRAVFHIVENHDDMAGHYDDVLETISDPDLVLPGYHGSSIAVRNYGRRRFLFAIYREPSGDDGFVITA
jgi:hypothetical protein